MASVKGLVQGRDIMPKRLFLTITLFILLNPALALAEGRGILIGESRLHLGIALETGYDTNVAYTSDATGDVVLHVMPALRFDLPMEKVTFTIGGILDVVRYFGVNNSLTKEYSTVQGTASTELVVNPKGKFIFKLRDDFIRSSEPRSDVLGTFARTDNSAGVAFQYKPGGGAFLLSLSYKFMFDFYDKGTGLSASDYYSHLPEFELKWNFFSKTALVFDVSANITRFPNSYAVTPQIPTQVSNSNLNIVKAMVGVAGLITPRLSTVVMIGYANSLLQQSTVPPGGTPQDNFNSVVATVKLDYNFPTNTKLGFSFVRDVIPASFFAFYASNKFTLTFNQRFLEKFSLIIDGGVDLQYYDNPLYVIPPAKNSRTDYVPTVRAEFRYEIKDWVYIALNNYFEYRNTDYVDTVNTNAGYTKDVVLLIVNFMY